MPTRDQIVASIAVNLNDNGVYNTSTDLNNSIQDAYDEVCAYCGQIEKHVTINQQNTVYYDIPSIIPDCCAITAIYDYPNKRWLIDANTQMLDQIRWDWEIWTGEPFYWIPHAWNKFALVPHQPNPTGQIEVFYRAAGATLVGTDTPLILSDSTKLLEFYGTEDALAIAKEFKKSKIWLDQYKSQLDRYQQDCKQLSKPDRYLTFSQYNLNYPRLTS